MDLKGVREGGTKKDIKRQRRPTRIDTNHKDGNTNSCDNNNNRRK